MILRNAACAVRVQNVTVFSTQRREDLQSLVTAALDELKWKRGAGVWYTARYDEDDPPLKKIDGCRRVTPGAVVLMLTTVVGVY